MTINYVKLDTASRVNSVYNCGECNAKFSVDPGKSCWMDGVRRYMTCPICGVTQNVNLCLEKQPHYAGDTVK